MWLVIIENTSFAKTLKLCQIMSQLQMRAQNYEYTKKKFPICFCQHVWIVFRCYFQTSISLSMLDTPEDCPRNQEKQSTGSVGNFCEIINAISNYLLAEVRMLFQYLVPSSRTIESQKLDPKHVPGHPTNGKHPSPPPGHDFRDYAIWRKYGLLTF